MQLGLTRIVSSFLGPNCSQSPSGVGSAPAPPQLLPEPLKLWVRDILFDMARRKQTQTCNLGVGLMLPRHPEAREGVGGHVSHNLLI